MQGIVRHLHAPGVRFVLPKSDGPGWYAARAIDPLTTESRGELEQSLSALGTVIDTARSAMAGKPLLLIGFSQGACLSAEYLMRHGPFDGAAALLTGCRVGHRSDNPPIRNLAGMPIYASCGDNDPWIPAAAHYELLADLTRAGARIRTDMVPGRAHEVAPCEIAVLQMMIEDLAAGRAQFEGGTR